MEHLPLVPLTEEELVAFDYFEVEDYDITFDDRTSARVKEPRYWIPYSTYILGNKPLSAVLLSPTHENGFDNLDLDVLCVDEDLQPLTNLPSATANDYEKMHGITNSRRGGNRHGPQNIRRGRRGGGVTRRRPREQVPANTAANKRLALGDPGTSAANEVVQVEDLDVNALGETQEPTATATGPTHPSGTSWLSGSTSSIKEKIRELITMPSFLSNLSSGIFYWYLEWIEKKEVPLSDSVAVAFSPQPITPGKIYQTDWNANNAAIELIEQYLEYQKLADTYKTSLETCQGLLWEAEDELKPLKDEVETLQERAALLEETEENVKALTKAVETANTEKEVAMLDAFAEAEARGVVKAVAEFKQSEDYVTALHKRYDSGWAASMRPMLGETIPQTHFALQGQVPHSNSF
ncbi:hypothetical protein BVRB_4g087690 [Beta vulgaris subsp. vulgaris]|nr:hypothetical protein BVRB_4g087690 [Beta vulgaris subsp. vulgaris]